jgi:hypothetical protein
MHRTDHLFSFCEKIRRKLNLLGHNYTDHGAPWTSDGRSLMAKPRNECSVWLFTGSDDVPRDIWYKVHIFSKSLVTPRRVRVSSSSSSERGRRIKWRARREPRWGKYSVMLSQVRLSIVLMLDAKFLTLLLLSSIIAWCCYISFIHSLNRRR